MKHVVTVSVKLSLMSMCQRQTQTPFKGLINELQVVLTIWFSVIQVVLMCNLYVTLSSRAMSKHSSKVLSINRLLWNKFQVSIKMVF